MSIRSRAIRGGLPAQSPPESLAGIGEETMRDEARIYRISDAGAQALAAQSSVPAWYRSILGLITGGDTPSDVVCRSIDRHPPQRVLAWLEELETLGFVEVVAPARLPHDLVT
jgi:hypothetical protein